MGLVSLSTKSTLCTYTSSAWSEVPAKRKPTFSDTDDSFTSGFFLSLKVTLGTSLFLPACTPASKKPDETSITSSACFRSIGGPQLAVSNATSSMGRPANAGRRIMAGFYLSLQFPVASFQLLELTNLDLGARFISRQAAGEIVRQIAAFDAQNDGRALDDVAWRQRSVTPARGHREPLVWLQLE